MILFVGAIVSLTDLSHLDENIKSIHLKKWSQNQFKSEEAKVSNTDFFCTKYIPKSIELYQI